MKKELPDFLSYHSRSHTMDVLKSAVRIAEQECVDGKDLLLLKTAALYHDSGFLFGLEEHEKLSCNFVRKVLPPLRYSREQIDLICGMIMATKLPQMPKNHLEEILCDADLDYLGREDFWEISELLYKEFIHLNIVKKKEDWNKLQIQFFESHDYFTDTAKKWRQIRKEKHLEEIRKMVI